MRWGHHSPTESTSVLEWRLHWKYNAASIVWHVRAAADSRCFPQLAQGFTTLQSALSRGTDYYVNTKYV